MNCHGVVDVLSAVAVMSGYKLQRLTSVAMMVCSVVARRTVCQLWTPVVFRQRSDVKSHQPLAFVQYKTHHLDANRQVRYDVSRSGLGPWQATKVHLIVFVSLFTCLIFYSFDWGLPFLSPI